jgi:RNA polymerase sigma factor for flagellar operon FliA
VCRRHRLRDDEAEDFAAEVKLHLVENDYDVLRKFEKRSSFATYLTVVVTRRFLNYRNRVWGRWRPSAEACRLGPLAIQLERLTTRDGWAFEEAVEQLVTNHGVTESRDQIYEMWLRLAPASAPRRFVVEEEAVDVPSIDPGPECAALAAEQEFTARRARAALERVLQTLSDDERLLFKLQYDDGFKVSEIARLQNVNQKKLYRDLERLKAEVRRRLEAEGISADDIREGTRG